MIDTSAPASTNDWPSAGSTFRVTPSPAMMKANSPICASEAEMVSAVLLEWPKARTMANAAADLPSMMIATVASTCHGCASTIAGSNNMPTETKNSTAKASRSGSESCAALWLSSDSLSIIPAKNAPSAKDTPNSAAAPNATPRAMASTDRVNSSREPVPAMRSRIHGITRRPNTSITATNRPSCTKVQPMLASTLPMLCCWPAASGPNTPAITGIITSASTQARSSTISQPTAILPRLLSSRRRSSIARSSTTVEAVASEKPKISPCSVGQPISAATPQPNKVATTIWPMAPGMAMAFTAIKSLSEKCRPTPNISSITPISASWLARCWSATKPGVNGPTTMPATR